MSRKAGIICPIFSLPGKYGIGSIGKEAFRFVDFLTNSGQSYWQVLPLGHTKNGSPYEVISAFAGNPYLIDMELLVEDRLLQYEDLEELKSCGIAKKIDYKKLYPIKEKLLRKAYAKRDCSLIEKISTFQNQNGWLEDYACYNALHTYLKTESWQEWDEKVKFREEETMNYYKEILKEEMGFWYFVQYIFFQQWGKLKQYANSKNIQIVGDIPFYVSMNSVDVWVNPNLFLLDRQLNPVKVAGCPPDNFSDEGQYWGYPVYNWDAMKEEDYRWWHNRIICSKSLYDMVRLDHFIGFERAWHLSAETKKVSEGNWVKGPSYTFFERLFEKDPELDLIAEDLGAVDEDIIELCRKTKCLGMKVLLLGFDSREKMDYRPHTYVESCVAYTTVHDTEPIMGWFETGLDSDIAHAIKYLNLTEEEGYHWGMIRGVYSSVARIAMIQLQDLLGYGSWSRMNIPPLLAENWTWRLEELAILTPFQEQLYEVTKRYNRLGNSHISKTGGEQCLV